MRNLFDLERWMSVGHGVLEGEVDNLAHHAWFRVENGQYVTVTTRTEVSDSEVLYATLFPADADGQMPENPDEWDGGSMYVLGRINQFEEFKFWAPAGGVKLQSYNPGGDPPEQHSLIWVFTGQGENWVQPPVEGESFARVMDRAPRNEEFDKMMHSVMYNVERRLAQAEDNHGRTIAQINARHQADLEAIRAERESAADGGEGGGEPPAAGGASDEGAATVKGGKAKSNDVA